MLTIYGRFLFCSSQFIFFFFTLRFSDLCLFRLIPVPFLPSQRMV